MDKSEHSSFGLLVSKFLMSSSPASGLEGFGKPRRGEGQRQLPFDFLMTFEILHPALPAEEQPDRRTHMRSSPLSGLMTFEIPQSLY
jgi:hypothetical protein